MSLSKEQRNEFEKLARPIIEWLNNNSHPHATVIITPASGEIVEGLFFFPTTDYVKD